MCENHLLWYQQPAKNWNEALPLGNGRLGGMIFGGVDQDKIQLNEDSIWYGGPKDSNNPDAQTHLSDIRHLLTEGKQQEAEHLARMSMLSQPRYVHPYQPLGDMYFWFFDHTSPVNDYQRDLNLETAIASVNYKMKETLFSREYFSSAVDQVFVVRLTSNRPGGLNFSVQLMRRPFDLGTRFISSDTIMMSGECGRDGIAFYTAVKAVHEGGHVRTIGDSLSVENADCVTLFLSAATTFYHDAPEQVCLQQVEAASCKSYDALKAAHMTEYKKKFERVSLELSSTETEHLKTSLPTDLRLKQYQEGAEDLGLVSLFFQYGRYLLISSSRPKTRAANLQGIWNDQFVPQWESAYTININTQMNYWPAEVANLAECHEPLFDLIERMREKGRITAREVYGCRGFVAHHHTNIWGETHIEGIPLSASIWPMGAAWLSLHLWEHYRFSGDEVFLAERAYPVLKEATEFFLDYLVKDHEGRLLTGPSVSPENVFKLPDGSQGSLCMGPTMDTQILHFLFNAVMEAGEIVGRDEKFRLKVEQAKKRLPQLEIGKQGQIMEWVEDRDEVEPGHRHISQLFALHPGEAIHPIFNPALAKAAKETIKRRLKHGGGHTGWSRAWIINYWARLWDGDSSYENIRQLLTTSVYMNLLDAHPPFQIDGNFGGTAGIAEMLIQSHANEIILLPSLPKLWTAGTVKGLRARGGCEVDITWENGSLSSAKIKVQHSGTCRIRTSLPLRVKSENQTLSTNWEDSLLTFAVLKDHVYDLTPSSHK